MFLYAFILFLSIEFFINRWVEYLNQRNFKNPLPSSLKELYSQTEYQKAQAYKQKNYRFHFIESVFSFLLILVVLWKGLLGKLDIFLHTHIENSLLQSLVFFLILYFISWLISLPFSYYRQFVIEEKFGFNKASKYLFFKDALKKLFLGGIMIILLASIIIWIYSRTGKHFWWYAWIIFAFFAVFINLFYTSLILPLFNKLTPLTQGDLKERLKILARKTDYGIDEIYVMDGSKRSTKANAFFSGFGPKKKVVLYDTLLNDLDENEISAVLAHEIGHYKKKHILFHLVLSLLTTGFFLYLFSRVIDNEKISLALGAEKNSFHIGIIAFAILFIPVSFLLDIISRYISRKFEYQADAFAAQYEKPEFLVSALKKLSKKSLTNLTPHPWYVFINYSHPPLINRIEALLSDKIHKFENKSR